jgi:putative ABC transport system permease protein
MIVPLIPEHRAVWWDSWDNLGLVGYVRLEKNADPKQVEKKMNDVAVANNFAPLFEVRLQPLLDVHLGSAEHYYDFFNRGKNDIVVVYTMGAIGILILLIACFNFINLSTSRASKRAREVGMRKVIGSAKRQLITQFLGESLLMTISTFLVALGLVYFTLPSLDNILNKQLKLGFSENPVLILVFFAVTIIIGILSGIYPAVVLSSFKPVNVIKGEYQTGKKGVLMRRILVVSQFAITTALIVGVFMVYGQIKYLKSKDMGYNREQVLVVFDRLGSGDDIFAQRLKNLPSVVSVGRMDAVPAPNFFRTEIVPEGFDRESNFTASQFHVDEGLFDTLEISIISGRNFSKEFPTDLTDGIIVNEKLVQKALYEDPVGRSISIVNEEGNTIPKQIVGVIRDFHYITVRQAMEPMIFFLNPQRSPLVMVRVAPGQIAQTLTRIEEIHSELNPDSPFNHSFLDESFEAQFNSDKEFMRNIGIFSGIAIFIACLGLIGLVAYAIEQRQKEVVIRKVLGCGEKKIFTLLASDFLKWVLLANIIAWPGAYFAMNQWLNGFTYRVSFLVWPFLIAAAASALIALVTISLQTMRAARANPVDILRQIG